MTGFDLRLFATAIRTVITVRGLTDSAAGRRAGVGPSTMTRVVRQGRTPDIATVAALADWAGLPLDAFITRRHPIRETPLTADVRRLVAAQQSAATASNQLAELLAGATQEGTTP